MEVETNLEINSAGAVFKIKKLIPNMGMLGEVFSLKQRSQARMAPH